MGCEATDRGGRPEGAPIRVKMGVDISRGHSLYREILEAPPCNVTYRTNMPQETREPERPSSPGRKQSEASKVLIDTLLASCLPGKRTRVFSDAATRAYGLLFGRDGDNEEIDFDLYHSPGNSMIESIPWIVENEIRWLVDCEHVGSLVGYSGDWQKRLANPHYRKILLKQLSSSYCRKIMPWTEAARKGILQCLPGPEIERKVEVVRLAIRPAPEKPSNIVKGSSVRILFVGSSNFAREFWSKGGMEVLESFKLLRERLGKDVELVFRCWIPEEIKSRYAQIPGITFVDRMLSREELNRLFWESDMFLFPSHNTPGMAYLEAMRFGLPIVTKDVWANNEVVVDGVNGLLVRPSEAVPYVIEGGIPNWTGDDGPFLQYMMRQDKRVINDLADAMQRLAESKALRERMGSAGENEILHGKLSVGTRNKKLERIYRDALS